MGLQNTRSRTFLLWISGIQMVIHIFVTIGFIILDLLVRNCGDDCFMNELYTEILEFLHMIPLGLAILLFIGILRNDLTLLRIWLIVVMGASIIIFSIQIGVLVFYIQTGLNYEVWCTYIPLFIEMILLLVVIGYVFQYYNNQRKLTTEVSDQVVESGK